MGRLAEPLDNPTVCTTIQGDARHHHRDEEQKRRRPKTEADDDQYGTDAFRKRRHESPEPVEKVEPEMFHRAPEIFPFLNPAREFRPAVNAGEKSPQSHAEQ